MKRSILFAMIFLVLFLGNAYAVFNSGSTGADGAFNPTADTELQLPPDGVFNFTTVNIPSGVTVTFVKNSTNTPVYILATGDVVIDGTISVAGNSYGSLPIPGTGGPGGFDGGYGGDVNKQGGDGLGPGGGGGGSPTTSTSGPWRAGGGGFGELGGYPGNGGGAGGSSYGNSKLIPLIGGSGGGGASTVLGYADNYGGGGGGGAIMIASSTSIIVNGTISSDGGNGGCWNRWGWLGLSGGGSGGGIRLIANSIYGSGVISAQGGNALCLNKGSEGRIRLESYATSIAYTDPSYSSGLPGSVFPVGLPSLTITSVGAVNAPASPTGSYATPDITLPSDTTNPVTIAILGSNIPVGTTVTVTVVPQYGIGSSAAGLLSGTEESSSTSVDVDLSIDYPNIIKAEATFTQSTAMYWEGEKIEKVKIASMIGGKSEILYITEKGDAIRAEELILAGVLRR